MIPEIEKINVFHNEDFVGTLRMTPEGRSCVFEYSPEWIQEGFALSPFELPLKSELLFSQPDKFDRNFAVFEDSMPDVQRKALEILSEKGEGDVSLLYYNSANSGGARPKIVMSDSQGHRM